MLRVKIISNKVTSHLRDGKTQFQKTLEVREEKTNELYNIDLRDDWAGSQIENGDVVNIIGTFINNICVVDSYSGLIVIHPDILVSSTHIADSFKCPRRAVLQDQIRATGETSKPLVYGSIIHELFQSAICLMDFSTVHLEATIDRLVIRHFEQLYCIDVDPKLATKELREKIPLIQIWADLFVIRRPTVPSLMADHCGTISAKSNVWINKVLDIEEHIWSPTYGLKGNIDATVQACIEEPNVNRKTLIVPLELKTGKYTSLVNHRAQTMLYSLMMSDRYDVDVECGLLYYVDAMESIRVRTSRNEVRGLIMRRNELAKWIKDRNKLPGMLKSPRDCTNCYARDSCLVYHKVKIRLMVAYEDVRSGHRQIQRSR